MAIPRGGVPIGRVVADALDGELDVILVRKLGAPGNPELAIGAVDERGLTMLNEYARWAGVDEAYIQEEAQRQLALIRIRRARYDAGGPGPELGGRTVIVVDDGLATGSTMIAALKAARARGPAHLVCAVPVAARDSLAQVARFADTVVCLATPSPFKAVGRYYIHFGAVTDPEVIALLAPSHATPELPRTAVKIPVADFFLDGDLTSPPHARGLVIFAHGSGSSRASPRNRSVAAELNKRGFATLLFDLLTEVEDRDRNVRFDIPLLAQRLEAGVQWARAHAPERDLPVGLFGASTGAAAAVVVAANRPRDIAAVVSRGGRPDLAGVQRLSRVQAPTLLIVGGDDDAVLDLNRIARGAMRATVELAVIPHATHLFEEPGALEHAAALAGDWFARWLDGSASMSRSASG
jgi:predicted phosphoribosyltransferase/predicted alpha/beta-hydrolase family hydrolase